MSTITKMALAVLAGLLVGGGTLAVADNGADDGLETMTVTTTTEEPGDVSGPCDEAEHANDPRCDGTQRPENGAGGDDNSGSGSGSSGSGHSGSGGDDDSSGSGSGGSDDD